MTPQAIPNHFFEGIAVLPDGSRAYITDEGASKLQIAELPGTTVHVLDSAHRPLPAGAVGELAIAGGALAHGYLNLPDTTAARFTAPEALDGQRVYLTGDRGYRHAGVDGVGDH